MYLASPEISVEIQTFPFKGDGEGLNAKLGDPEKPVYNNKNA